MRRSAAQVADLRLDLRKVPKGKDIAVSLANEWIVSQRLAELMLDAGLTGFELRRVWHKGHYEDDPYYLHETPTGRKILEIIEEVGIEHGTWPYYVWINRPEKRPLAEQSRQEMAAMKRNRAKQRGKPAPVWYQLVPTSQPVEIVPPTKTGINPFDPDPDNQFRCPRGDLVGLTMISEAYLDRARYDGSDVAVSRQYLGIRQGDFGRPFRLLLISRKFWGLLEANKIKGYKVEVAHLI